MDEYTLCVLKRKIDNIEKNVNLLVAANKEFRSTLEWIVVNPGMHPSNLLNQCKASLDKHKD